VKTLFVLFFFLAAFSACAASSHDSFNIASVESPGRLETVALDSAHIELSLPRAWQSKPEFHENQGSTMCLFLRQAIYDSQGAQVIIAGTESVFDMLDPEYKLILGQLRYL
jgi:hypothetical protein